MLYEPLKADRTFTVHIEDIEGHKRRTSIFSIILRRDDLLSISNVDFSLMVPSYEQARQGTPNIDEIACYDMLQALKSYDKSGLKNEVLLNALFNLNEWIIGIRSADDISSKINRYQLIKRLRGLNDIEKKVLKELIPQHMEYPDILAGIYFLLDDKEEGEKYYSMLDKETREIIDYHPISHFRF